MSNIKTIIVKDIQTYEELVNKLTKYELEALWTVFDDIVYPKANFFSLLLNNKEKYQESENHDFVDNYTEFMKDYGYKTCILSQIECILLLREFYPDNKITGFTQNNVKYVFDRLSDFHKLHRFLSTKQPLKRLATENEIFATAIRVGFISKKEHDNKIVHTGLSIPFFNREDLTNLPELTNESYQKIFKSLQQKNAEQRQLVQIHKESIKESLNHLREDFPNFIKVIDFIEEDLALYGRGVHPDIVKFEPILLGGAPGVGKTEFARRVSELFNVPLSFTDMSASSSPRVLGGSDSTWKDSKPGVIFNQLWEGNVANPIFFLDEIDKVSKNSNEGYALTSLYSLLETSSNNAFKDEFFPLPINTKYINFIAAGNDISKIPEPLLTRFNYFDIQKPEGAQLRNIAKSVMRSLLTKVFPEGHGLSDKLSDDILDYIEQSDMSPRHIARMFKHGFKNALKNDRVELMLSDIKTYSPEVTFSYSM